MLKGKITLQEEGKEKKTYEQGGRADVGANVEHEAWIGSAVCLLQEELSERSGLYLCYRRMTGQAARGRRAQRLSMQIYICRVGHSPCVRARG